MLPLLPPSLLLLLALLPAPSDALPSPLPSYPPPNPPQSSGPIPDYVLAHAPLIHLAQTESYWPSSVASHLAHTRLHWTNGTLLSPPSSPSSPPAHPDLSALAAQGNRSDLYLEGGVMAPDFEAGRAAWLGSAYGVPDARGRSQGEVYIVLVDKGDIIAPGYLDAFFFTFYSYNEGNTLFDVRFGDHLGDWEHVMLRFYLGEPQQLFLSEHAFGEVWPFDVVGKGDGVPFRTASQEGEGKGKVRRGGGEGGMDGAMRRPKEDREGWAGRPVVYSAEGSHALYGTSGRQEYLLPFGLLHDVTSPGPLWDPVLNHRAFWLNTSTSTWWRQELTFVPASRSASASSGGEGGGDEEEGVGKGVLEYAGRWGDEFWSVGGGEDRQVAGQYCYFGNCRFVNGPMGPRYKYLDRRILDPIDFTFDLILAICALILLSVLVHALSARILRPPLFADRTSPKWFRHLFPFCFLPLFSLSPEPVRRPAMRQRKNTWYPEPDERTPLL